MRAIVLGLTLLPVFASCGGCAAPPLKQYALNQAMSITNMRYQQVLDDLAVVANNSGVLPAFALTAGGSANVTNTLSIESVTLWDQAVKGFSMETLTAFAQHSPELQWTLTPVASSPQLEALGYACLWALSGPPPEGSRPMELLREPRITDIGPCTPAGTIRPKPAYHLDVASQLAAMPPGWVRVAPKHLAAKNARYQATCGNTSVWVPDENVGWLSEFTLILLDIATIDPTTLVLPSLKVSVDIAAVSKPPAVAGSGQVTAAPPRASSTPDGVNAAAWDGQVPPPIMPLPEITSTAAAPAPESYMGYVIRTPQPGEKITELWDACQDPCTKEIALSRPKTHRYPRSAMPIVKEQCFEGVIPPTKPQLTTPAFTTIR